MFLDADKSRGEAATEVAVAGSRLGHRWNEFPFSPLSHHEEACCDVARDWVIANDFAQLNGSDRLSGPRWLRQLYKWGPSSWPLHWCEALAQPSIDCGAHAALAHEAFAARGLTSFRAQFVQRYDANAEADWRTRWSAERCSDHWLDGNLIYHEGNALLAGDDELKFWDPSAGWWINPRQAAGYGSLAMVRIWTEGRAGSNSYRWGARRIAPDVWCDV
jgi:hypothetical protein